MMLARGLLMLSLFVVFSAMADSSPRWEMAKSQDGITIYTRPHQAGLVEIRARMFVATSYGAFMALLEDSPNIPSWVDNVSSSRVLEQLSPTENIVYTRFRAPWPVQDRDMVTYSRFEQPPGALVLTIEDAFHAYPRQPGYIRIRDVKVTWTLAKLTNGLTHIEYVAFADPGGNLPGWLTNQLSVTSAFNTFQGLRAQLPEYQTRVHSQVRE
ncbi:START domain-containing protein [Oceanimonas sp. CHS3-5]|uniref:START domain-containing protein n=1 Tax=Oceanimonas sp. CHS3-5 TaxID=3068186 RepID=UPI00273E5414|nr:START domain-containing protein [Oceanimonas sp. CHS3-5]MDP5291325.1 START domain-containing protein [Oceanimonas sp. CHS3-5]